MHRIISLLVAILAPATACAQTADRGGGPRLIESVDSVMRAAEAIGFSGVVRIEKGGSVILEKGYGLANRADGIAFTPSTVVQIGSNTKDFTAVAILQLKERGLLDLGDPIGKYFPNAPDDKKNITIQQLLDHQAGFPLGLGPDFEQKTRGQLVDGAMSIKLLFNPGQGTRYSNTGYALLAAIIEQITGKTYDEYLRDSIIAPLGLTHTGFHLPGFDPRTLAHGYDVAGKDAGTMLSKSHAADGPYWNLRGNGGMLSTVGDMHEFYKALFETEKLLKAATRNLRFNPNEPVALAGSDLISVFIFERDPVAKFEIIIASTNASQKADRVLREIASVIEPGRVRRIDRVAGNGTPTPRRGGKTPPAAVSAMANQLIATLNSGDADRLRTFVAEHFVSGDGAPTVEQRMERLSGIHGNMGNIRIVSMVVTDTGALEITIQTEREGQGVLILDLGPTAPYRIRRLGIQIG